MTMRWLTFGILLILCACTTNQGSTTRVLDTVPRSDQAFFNDPDNFQFVILGDRTGGHRPGVFRAALEKVNLLRPEFVVSVGDLIEGYSDDLDSVEGEWTQIETMLAGLEAPTFYLVGNHDVSSPELAEIWRERRGADYYSFVYRDVLFLALNTEDPAVELPAEALAGQARLKAAMAADPDAAQARILEAVGDRGLPPKLPGSVNISDEQLSFVSETLDAHSDVRWTMVFLHKPAWIYDSAQFAQIEEMLHDRDYSVIAGHEHYYDYEERNDQDYIIMGTTGGVWLRDGPGRVDHITWVTMTDEGPVFANIEVDGIFGKDDFE